MKNKGFTLIELLAVIVVLGIIMLIAVVAVSSFIENSKRNAFKSDAKILIKDIDYSMYVNMDNPNYDVTSINESNIESTLGVSVKNYQTIETSLLRGDIYLIIQGQNNYKNLVAYGTYDSMQVTINSTGTYNTIKNQITYDPSTGVNAPQLAKGMVPIKWNGNGWVTTLEEDPEWYDYSSKEWANAKTADGSMWVWIPRYIYKISAGWHSSTTGTIEVQFTKGIDDNWNSSVIGNIDTGTTSNASNKKWTNHPGFTFGTDEVTGIWVAKFEATAAEGVANGHTEDGGCPSESDDVTSKTPKIIPDATSWRCIKTGNAFDVTRNMETNAIYGWGTTGNGIDTHLMKNTEWGAVAYLSKTVDYGQGTNVIWMNPTLNYTTGCAGNSAAPFGTETCLNAYNTTNGKKTSTTGTIYGVYDTVGGAWEKIAAYVDNTNDNLNTYGGSILGANFKYRDVYTKGTPDDQTSNYALAINNKGDAIYETSGNVNGFHSWLNTFSNMPNTSNPWFMRGGACDVESYASVFAFDINYGTLTSYASFRPILIVGNGL